MKVKLYSYKKALKVIKEKRGTQRIILFLVYLKVSGKY